MILKSLSIENFKGIGREVIFHFKPITLFFGENSAGKSTVLHALNYLFDLINLHSVNADTTSLGHCDIDLGGFKQFVHKHDLSKKIKLSLILNMEDEEVDLIETNAAVLYNELYELRQNDADDNRLPDLSIVTSKIDSVELKLIVAWSLILDKPFVEELSITYNDELMFDIASSSDCKRREIVKVNLSHGIFNEWGGSLYGIAEGIIQEPYMDESGDSLIGLINTEDALPDYRKSLILSDIWEGEGWENSENKAMLRGIINTLLIGPLEVAANELSVLKYLGPIREIPGRDYTPRKEKTYPWADGLAAWDALFRGGNNLVKAVNNWLSGEDKHDRLKTGYKVKIPEYKQLETNSRLMGLLQSSDLNENRLEIDDILSKLPVTKGFLLEDTRRDVEVYPGDVGVGISQLLPVVVGALSNEVKILSIEQPELHIHPGLQTSIGDLFIYAAKELDKLFILETHSEHVMLRLLRRIRETTGGDSENNEYRLKPEDLNVVYVMCVDGETRLITLEVDDEGEFIDRWPKGFFVERAEELL